MKNENMVTNYPVPGRFPLADLVYKVDSAFNNGQYGTARCLAEVANGEDWAREYVHGIPSIHAGINA